MKNFLTKIKSFIVAHKITSVVIAIVIIYIAYWAHGTISNTEGDTRYVVSAATRGTIISSVSGSGQVSALNQIAINPTVSGALTSVNVKPGDKVATGQTLFSIDDTTAQKTVRDALISLQNANLALQKIQLQDSDANLSTALLKSYNDGFNTATETFSDLNSTLTGLSGILGKENLNENAARASGNSAHQYQSDAMAAYYTAQNAYQKSNGDYIKLSSTSSDTDIANIINEAYNATKLLSNALQSASTYVDYMAQNSVSASDFTSYQTSLATYTNTINGDSTNLLSAQTNISSSQDSFPSSNIDTQSAEIAVEQAKNALTDAEQNLSYYSIKAPFDGIIASVPVTKGDNVSSGTTLGTIITSKELAVVSLNEIDVAKIALGEKATLTFSAIPDLTIAGQVAEIDSVGTVSQGVVNYNVQISFDTSDTRVKPGMSVDAEIITEVDQNVLVVPNGAIKTQNGTSYVQMFNTALPAPAAGIQGSPSTVPPTNQAVTVGISDDTMTEITSGLKEGDEIVTKTITPTTKTSATTTPTILGSGTGRGGGVRIP